MSAQGDDSSDHAKADHAKADNARGAKSSDGKSTKQPDQYTAAAMDSRMLWIPLACVTVVGIITTIVCVIVAGGPGLTAGVIGTLVVGAFFGGGQYVVSRVLRNNPMVAMNTALLVYVVQMAVLFGLLLVLRDATFFAPKAFAATVVICAFTWTIAMLVVMTKTKVLYVEPGSGPQKNY